MSSIAVDSVPLGGHDCELGAEAVDFVYSVGVRCPSLPRKHLAVLHTTYVITLSAMPRQPLLGHLGHPSASFRRSRNPDGRAEPSMKLTIRPRRKVSMVTPTERSLLVAQ